MLLFIRNISNPSFDWYYFRPISRIIIIVLISLAFPSPAYCDTVILRNGIKYENVTTRFEGDTLIIEEKGIRIPIKDTLSVVPGPVKKRVPKKETEINGNANTVNEIQPVTEKLPVDDSKLEDNFIKYTRILSGPTPGFSPYWFDGRPIAASLSGGSEILALILFYYTAAPLDHKNPDDYFFSALIVNEVSNYSTGMGQSSGQQINLNNSIFPIVETAFTLYAMDRFIYSPVRHPLNDNRWITESNYREIRNRSAALLAATLVLDSISLIDIHPANSGNTTQNVSFTILPVWNFHSREKTDSGFEFRLTLHL